MKIIIIILIYLTCCVQGAENEIVKETILQYKKIILSRELANLQGKLRLSKLEGVDYISQLVLEEKSITSFIIKNKKLIKKGNIDLYLNENKYSFFDLCCLLSICDTFSPKSCNKVANKIFHEFISKEFSLGEQSKEQAQIRRLLKEENLNIPQIVIGSDNIGANIKIQIIWVKCSLHAYYASFLNFEGFKTLRSNQGSRN